MTRETGIQVCGLCHGHHGHREIARVLGLDPEKARAQAVGLNHLIYLTHLEYEGRDAYPLLDEWIETQSEAYWQDYHPRFHENQMSRAAIEQYKLLGLMPIGDTPRVGGWWFHTDLEAKQRWYGEVGGFDSEIGWGQYLDGLEAKVQRIWTAADDPSARLTELFPPQRTGEQHFPLIDALVNDNRAQLQVNVPNRGAIEGVPDDVVVEVPALCSRRGIQPIHVARLPGLVMLNSIWPRILHMERTISLALRPDPRMLLYTVLDDHRTRSWDEAVAFCREVLSLPELSDWAAEMARSRWDILGAPGSAAEPAPVSAGQAAPTARAKLSDILLGMECPSDEMTAYLDRQTGGVITMMDDELQDAEERKPLDGEPEWRQRAVQQAREILEDDETRFLPLPTKFDIDEYGIMKRFCRSVEDDEVAGSLRRAIRGRGAFRRFKDGIHRFGIAHQWYAYRDQESRRLAIEWCEENHVDYVDD